jgi:hypothetical protein
LGGRVALLGSFAKPFHRLKHILGHALALMVADSEIVLGFGIALFSHCFDCLELLRATVLLRGQSNGQPQPEQ